MPVFGIFPYIDSTGLFVDDVRYTVDADTVLTDEDGNTLAVSGADIVAFVCVNLKLYHRW